ncbi:MAG: M16 family metallopeptidase [Akkermansiaceae bacterium]
MEFPKTHATVETLKPGLDLILDPTPGAAVISAQIWVATGSMHESALAGAGISHLLEHMVFKGTDRFSGEELSLEVQAAGGQWNAYTTYDRTVYYIDGPAASLDLFLSALTEMVFRPAFPEGEFEKEKDVIRREIAMGLDDPDSVAHEHNFRTIFSRDPRRHPIIGHRDLFDSISHEQMVTYHHARYRPENCFLVLSGGFDASEARTIVTRELDKGLRPFREFPVSIPTEPAQIGTRHCSEPFDLPSSHLSMTWKVPDLGHPDTPALELLSTVLGGGRSTPLYRIIREELGLVHSIGSYAWITPDAPGLFSVHAEAKTENLPEIESQIHAQIQALSSRVLEKEITRASRQMASAQFKTLATASGRASDLASNWHQTRNLDFTGEFVAQLNQVTTEDLHRVIATYLSPNRVTVATLDPESAKVPVSESASIAPKAEIQEHTLSNGLRVILQNDPRVPVVYGNLALLAGCLSETPETAGLNALLSSLLLKGTSNRSAAELAESLEDLGASLRPGAGNNTLLLSSYCLRDDLAPVLDLLGDVLTNSTFPAEALEREKAAITSRLKEALNDPASRAFRELRHQMWDGQGYGIPSSGTEESLAALDRDQILSHYQSSFTAGNLVLALFGDLDPEKVLPLLENSLGQLRADDEKQYPPALPTHSGEHHLTLDKKQAVLAIGYPGISASDPRRHALELLHSYCSDMAGPLFTNIREELGLAYYVSSSMFLGVNAGLFSFYLGTAPDQLDLARTTLEGEIKKLATEGIPADRLASVKANARAATALQNQSPKSRASLAALDVLLGLPAKQHTEQDDLMDAVTGEEIQKLAAELLQEGKATVVVVTP